MPNHDASQSQTTRRSFLKTSTAVGATAALGNLAVGRSAHAAGSDVLKVGLIGCGGRGNGAAANALDAEPNCKLTAMGDAFEDRVSEVLRSTLRSLHLTPLEFELQRAAVHTAITQTVRQQELLEIGRSTGPTAARDLITKVRSVVS